MRLAKIYITIAVILASGAFVVGIYIGAQPDSKVDAIIIQNEVSAPVGVDLTPLWKAWNTLDTRFVPASSTAPKLTDEEKLFGAIQGLAEAYGDPYTVFLPPVEAEIFEDDISGSFGGVGMEIIIDSGILSVVTPLKNTPADRAGILPGDRIFLIDGNSTDGITIDKAVSQIRGEIGTEVVLTISREGVDELLEIPVERDVIQIPTVDYELLDNGVFVISLYNFNANANNLFRQALREFSISDSNKLILDLRGNPGGFLEIAIDVASWFLPAGEIIVTEDFGFGGGDPRHHRSRGYNIFGDDLQLAILVNQGSASASEIVTGALQEHGKATVIGAPTFGKGSVQELVKVTPDSSLKVTIAQWLTPDGKSISDGGITPDIEVLLTQEDIDRGDDPQMTAALHTVLGLPIPQR